MKFLGDILFYSWKSEILQQKLLNFSDLQNISTLINISCQLEIFEISYLKFDLFFHFNHFNYEINCCDALNQH